MSTRTVRERIDTVTDELERAYSHYELAVLNGRVDVSKADRLISALESVQRDFTALVASKPVIAPRTDAERLTDLISALERIAQQGGARLLQWDALQSMVVMNVATEAQAYWGGQQPARIHGLLLNEKAIGTELEARGVLIWTDEVDRLWRIVNTNWLTLHAEIRAFVAGDRIRGRVCRFCRMVEVPTSQQLVAVDAERPGPLTTVNGVTQLQAGRVYVHPQCSPYWKRWVEIANRYPTQEDAERADREAGRSSGSIPDPPEPLMLDAKAPEGFIHVTTEGDCK